MPSLEGPEEPAAPPPPARPARRQPRDDQRLDVERAAIEQLIARVSQHRQAGRAALLVGDLDTAFDELWLARQLEPDLDRFGAAARRAVPLGWEAETDLVPLARALSARHHPRATEAWRGVLDDTPARSIQAEAADWLASAAFASGEVRYAVRVLHAASRLGRTTSPATFHAAYKQAGLDPAAAFASYLSAARTDPRSARAAGLRDPLTGESWPDQDARWWLVTRSPSAASDEVANTRAMPESDHQAEAFHRAADLTLSRRDQGWLLLAEGDYLAGPLGVRPLGRFVRSGHAEPADHDLFVRIRVAYEGAAERLPDVAWPWYRLAELLAWAGFEHRAHEQLAEAEKRSLGDRATERACRPLLRALVQAGLGVPVEGLSSLPRPFPPEPFSPSLAWRLKLR
jgi:hypothetical protein